MKKKILGILWFPILISGCGSNDALTDSQTSALLSTLQMTLEHGLIDSVAGGSPISSCISNAQSAVEAMSIACSGTSPVVYTVSYDQLPVILSTCQASWYDREAETSKVFAFDGTIQLSGSGHIDVNLTPSFDNGAFTNTISGTIQISGDINISDCEIDITETVEVNGNALQGNDPTTNSVSWTGTICGASTSGSTNFISGAVSLPPGFPDC